MKIFSTFLVLILFLKPTFGQLYDTVFFDSNGKVSSRIEAEYYRIIEKDGENKNNYLVKDYFMNGQIEMTCSCSSLNPFLKELSFSFFSYSPNIIQGLYKRWYKNGQIKFECNYIDNKAEGIAKYWNEPGQLGFQYTFKQGHANGEEKEWRSNGNPYTVGEFYNDGLNGNWTFFDKNGNLVSQRKYDKGLCLNPQEVSYKYLSYLPTAYSQDSSRRWPLIICLHGTGGRGNDLNLIKNDFQTIIVANTDSCIIIAPQCADFIFWADNNWFDSLMHDLKVKYRIDKNRIYLTGASMGGSGIWDLAVRYPNVFAAIAPLCGSASSSYTLDNLSRIKEIPVWAFMGLNDLPIRVWGMETTIIKLKKYSSKIKYTRYSDLGHDIWHKTYSNPEFYKWLLSNKKNN